jgi:hypothetical protein
MVLGLLLLASAYFATMGENSFQQLDEGDFVIQPVLKNRNVIN